MPFSSSFLRSSSKIVNVHPTKGYCTKKGVEGQMSFGGVRFSLPTSYNDVRCLGEKSTITHSLTDTTSRTPDFASNAQAKNGVVKGVTSAVYSLQWPPVP